MSVISILPPCLPLKRPKWPAARIYVIQNIQPSSRGGWNYKGYFPCFIPHDEDKESLENVPCWTHSKKRWKGDHQYLLEGVIKKGRSSYSFQVRDYQEGNKRWTLAEIRAQMKETVRNKIKS